MTKMKFSKSAFRLNFNFFFKASKFDIALAAPTNAAHKIYRTYTIPDAHLFLSFGWHYGDVRAFACNMWI